MNIWPLSPLEIALASFIGAATLAYAFVRYFMWRYEEHLAGLAALMQGALHDLIRHMENNPSGTPGKNARGREATLVRVAVEGLAAIKPEASLTPPVGMIAAPPALPDPALTPAAQALIARNEEDARDFWYKAQGIRTGAQIFLAIMQLNNPTFAFILMTEHMKRQRDEWENKKQRRSPNFTELKKVLGLPTEWPIAEWPEAWQRIGITQQRAWDLMLVSQRYRERIFGGAYYKPWPRVEGAETPTHEGEDLLLGMREFIR